MGEHPDIVTNEENKLFLNSVVPEDTEMSTTLTANEWNSIQAHALFLIRQKQAREGQNDRRARRGKKQSKKSLGNKFWETWIEAAICAEDSVAVGSSEKEWPYSSQGEEGTMMMTVCNDFFNVRPARQATSCCRKKITNTDFIHKEWKTLKIIPVLAINPKHALTETEIYGSVCL